MLQKQYDGLAADLLETAKNIADSKRPGYTMGDEDVLKNFKRVAERVTDLTPLQVIDVYMLKHMDSISSYSDPNISQAEPVKERFADMINYLCLKYALLVDMGYVDAEFGQPCRAWGNPDTWTITNQPGSPGETL